MEEKKTFEELVGELGEIVKSLESGDAPLDESMNLFERGVKLAAQCEKMLDSAEKKVSVIVKETGEIAEFGEVE